MQFLEESKDAEGFLGDAAKFWIEHTDDGSHDGWEFRTVTSNVKYLRISALLLQNPDLNKPLFFLPPSPKLIGDSLLIYIYI